MPARWHRATFPSSLEKFITVSSPDSVSLQQLVSCNKNTNLEIGTKQTEAKRRKQSKTGRPKGQDLKTRKSAYG